MYCNKCGTKVDDNCTYCNHCGNYLGGVNAPNNFVYSNVNTSVNNQVVKKDNKFKFIVLGLVVVLVLLLFLIGGGPSIYFSDDGYDNTIIGKLIKKKDDSVQSLDGRTIIIADNTYEGVKIRNATDAKKLISKDSVDQKKKCPKDIKKVENEIIDKYGITAVNLCEMDVDFAKELENVIEKVYNEYPALRGHLTNLSLVNGNFKDKNYIAAFYPYFTFATSDSKSGYPNVMKTQVLLNTSYFFNVERLKKSISEASEIGWFPKNTTVYSPLAHEFGHYISFIAMTKHYNVSSVLLIDNDNIDDFMKLVYAFSKGEYSLSMIKEAYNNYKKDTNTKLSLDEWRGTISQYALAKDNSGNYIYDETIAESFHDVYLNGNNAAAASKYIVKVLKERVNK